MNRKLFTLAAALMLGSAFTVNAQTKNEAITGTQLDGATPYYLKFGDKQYLNGVKVEGENDAKEKVSTTTLSNQTGLAEDLKKDQSGLWYVTATKVDGEWKIQLKNKATGGIFTFNKTSGILAENSKAYDAINAATNSLMDADNVDDKDKDGRPDYVKGGFRLSIP